MVRQAIGRLIVASGVIVGALCGVGAAAGADEAATAVLDTTSYWRCHLTWKTPVVRTASGLEEAIPRRETPPPPAGWAGPDFDDAGWMRLPGPFFAAAEDGGCAGSEGTSPALSLLCLRGRFSVKNPAAAGDLVLSLAYRGGVVVSINGKELIRKHLPPGTIDVTTLAEDYPLEAFVRPDGKPIRGYRSELRKFADRVALRTRRLERVTVPASMLRAGTNVLAIECHRAAHHEAVMFGRKGTRLFYGGRDGRAGGVLRRDAWSTVGVPSVSLRAPAGTAVVPNVQRPTGFQVWNGNVAASVFDLDYGDPTEPLRPITIMATRNGAFSGQVVVGSTEPIAGLKAAMSDLRRVGGEPPGAAGAGSIPADRVQVRYALPGAGRQSWGWRRYHGIRDLARFDALAEMPPATVPVRKKTMPRGVAPPVFGAVQPIWVTVSVPADAAPGDYQGTLTIHADGQTDRAVPVNVTVGAWRLPDPHDYVTFADLIQSPESVAMQYEVPFWSDRHFELMGKSFEQMARIGAKAVYLPLICRTNLGNAESMVRWIKQPDGSFTHDFTIFDRYLDLAVKHLGKPKVVCLYVWESYTGIYFYGRKKIEKEVPHWDTVLVSVLDPATGTVTAMEGPPFLPEKLAVSEAFWTPVLKAAGERLKKRGLLDVTMLGLSWDHTPHKDAVTMLARLLPGMKWVHHAHGAPQALAGVPVGYVATVWNQRAPVDPAVKRTYGWNRPMFFTQFDRPRPPTDRPLRYWRVLGEWNITGGQSGFGRKGADFWSVLKTPRGYPTPNRLSSGRYVQSDRSNRNIYQPAWLAPGRDGAIATVRFELAREGVQESEARIFIERVLTDPARRAAIGEERADRCQRLLDERTRLLVLCGLGNYVTGLWYPASGWQERSAHLYAAAAEVADALQKH